MNSFFVDMNEFMPLREIVFNTLRKAILKGELKPGEHLLEVELANKLKVSRTPIREAIRKLEAEGFVNMEPRKGATVANITESDLNDVLEVRIVLEKMAIEKACERITPEQLIHLEAAAQAFQEQLPDGSLVDLAEADEKFHDIIYQAAGNKRLLQVLNNLREQIYRYRIEYLKSENTRDQLVNEHQEMTQAIKARDVVRARELSYAHLENQRSAILKSIKQQEEKKKLMQ